jgi:hypothetical protein
MVHIFSVIFVEFAEGPSLDRLLGKSILDWLVHEAGMGHDAGSAGTDEPKDCGYWGRKDPERHSNHKKSGVQLRGGGINRAYNYD